ncbi:LAFE_0F06612g1_1 [Lachancea fermentati]|uniref:LAFE_0F06612g1_1 n=1 Tax=Lachancea fermentati TaxID=4955 RepID=A0A1G4MF62_LACFM|nr:LAFE_0F06612g1_1 [Lachancea fermentati]
MPNRFYDDEEPSTTSTEGPLVPKLIPSPEVETKTLSTGNQIYDSRPISEQFHHLRKAVAHKLDIYNAEINTQRTAFANEVQSIKDYLRDNIFTDRYETEELIVPSSILGLGAFFTGRVLSNRTNWGFTSPFNADSGFLSRKPTVIGKLTTSLPSRIILPWLLVGTVFSQLTPVTWKNSINAIERDVLPQEFVSTYDEMWNKVYVSGIKQSAIQLHESLDQTLQSSSKQMREFISRH